LYAKEKRIKTLIIVPFKTINPLEYIRLGIDDFVFQSDSIENIECRIFKLLDISVLQEINVQRYEYITYILPNREVYIKGSKICLTTFESLFLNQLIINNGYCNMIDFRKYLIKINFKEMSRKTMVVAISRFKKKIYMSTGYKVIKSRYGLGYVINS